MAQMQITERRREVLASMLVWEECCMKDKEPEEKWQNQEEKKEHER